MAGGNSMSSGAKRPVAVGPTSAKLCSVCGKDVAQLPRVKDDQGRYFCKPCEARAAAQQVEENDSTKVGGDAPGSNGPAFEGGRNAPRPMTFSSPSRAVGNGIYDTGDGLDLSAAVQYEAQAEAVELPKEQRCPSCRGHMEQEARLCIHCGFDRQRKTRLSTKVEKVKAAKAGVSAAQVGAAGMEVGMWICMGLGMLALGVCWIPWVLPDLGIAAFAVVMAVSLAAYVTTTVCQFRDGETGWGIVSIVGFFIGIGGISNPLWAIGFSGRMWLSVFAGCAFVAGISVVLASYIGPAGTLHDIMARP